MAALLSRDSMYDGNLAIETQNKNMLMDIYIYIGVNVFCFWHTA